MQRSSNRVEGKPSVLFPWKGMVTVTSLLGSAADAATLCVRWGASTGLTKGTRAVR